MATILRPLFERPIKVDKLFHCLQTITTELEDGSDLNIPSLPGDTEHFIPYNSRNGGYYQAHLDALSKVKVTGFFGCPVIMRLYDTIINLHPVLPVFPDLLMSICQLLLQRLDLCNIPRKLLFIFIRRNHYLKGLYLENAENAKI